jgi:acylphosphatase
VVIVRRHVWVSGRVQGVWFRESTRRAAESLGVSGWVRNLPDGRVEAIFEGEQARVERAVDFVRQGPPRARVLRVEVCDEPVSDETAAGFEVR